MNDNTQISGTVPRWHRIALPASIILNLFLLAAIGGHVIQARHRAIHGTPLARVLARAQDILGPKDAAAFGAVMRRDAPKFLASSLQLRQAREQVEAQIAAEPFNPTATRQSLVAMEAAWGRFMDEFGGPLVDGLAQVSPEGRRKLVAETQMARAKENE